jgi:hypothetical protein
MYIMFLCTQETLSPDAKFTVVSQQFTAYFNRKKVGTAVNYCGIFITSEPGTNVIKLLPTVIDHHSMVIPLFCVIKH